jgi:hypothetical protein
MKHKKKKRDPDAPKPLNFDHEEEKAPVEPFMTPKDARGDDEEEQYYEEEEAISPEEVKKRKQEGTM